MSPRLPFVHVECASVCVTERGRGYERYSNNSTSSLSEPQTALKVMLDSHRSHWLDQNPPFLLLSSFLIPSLPCHLLSRSVDPTQKRVSVSTTQGGSPPGGATLFSIQQGWERGGHGKRILTNSASWAKPDLHAFSCLLQILTARAFRGSS